MMLRSSFDAAQAFWGKLGNCGGPVIAMAATDGSACVAKTFEFRAKNPGGGFEKSSAST